MSLPRSVKLKIDYDGTAAQASTETSAAAGSSSESSASGSSASAGSTYTVVAGDTLWGIAKRFLGNGLRYTEIYAANADVIESTAKQHGKQSSSNGHWIWPGEVLGIPGSSGAAASSAAVGSGTTLSTPQVDTSNPALGGIIAATASAFSYTDAASGQSDSASITMHDISKSWMGQNKPPKGASFGVKLQLTNWVKDGSATLFECGKFILDDISFSGRPINCVLGMVSVPTDDDFKSRQKTNTWQKTTVQDIAQAIASAAGVSLVYDADAIQVDELEQSNQTNSAFLYSLCEKYGLGMKVYNHKIVIFDPIRYEEKEVVATILETDMERWTYNETIDGTYTGVDLSYTNPDLDDPIKVFIGSEGRVYSLNVQANNQHDAELQAAAKVNAANRKIATMTVTLTGYHGIVATHCVNISGIESLDGKYYVDTVKHNIGSSGYTTQMTLHKVQTPVKIEAPAASDGSGSGASYTVVSGDTLWGISKKFYGTGTKYSVIYAANVDIIESTAKQHGKKSSENGHWIWPGETLTIPGG